MSATHTGHLQCFTHARDVCGVVCKSACACDDLLLNYLWFVSCCFHRQDHLFALSPRTKKIEAECRKKHT